MFRNYNILQVGFAICLLFALTSATSAQNAVAKSGVGATQSDVQNQIEQATAATNRLDYLAIQESIAGYLSAINNRDASAAAEFWSEAGVWVSEDGSRVTGIAMIEKALAKSFENESPEQEVSLRDLTIRFLSDDVALEEGVAVVSSSEDQKSESTYTVVHVKRDGKWKIDSIRETLAPRTPKRQFQLEKLGWLVGDWKDQELDDLSISASCDWTPGNHSLRRSFRVNQGDSMIFSGTQVIMWDAKMNRIRSWMFDSNGGFGNGTWTQTAEDRWVVDSEFQSAEGNVATSRNTYTVMESGDRFLFQSTNRVLDGVAMSDLPAVTVNKIKRDGE